MSLIESLTIQGIRSFGTKAEDRQNITFASPLTLILGENGCGKTTVIECLKYALTGEVPPGTNRGHSFVHDPQIFAFSESLGQVKLMVKNIRGEKLTVARSMKISHKRGKLSFETLDATMNYEIEGQKDSISKRCVDIDSEMCQFMGVSKAIINNVLLCHQEDSSWPLDEAKKLKEKFDAIFGTTEYNKAIEKIIKLRKDHVDELKDKEKDLKFLSHTKKELEDKTLDLQNATKKLENLQGQNEKYDEESKPIQDRIAKIIKVELEIGKLTSQKIQLSTKISNCQAQKINLRSKIKKIFEGNMGQLERSIRTFHEKMEEKSENLKNLEENLESIKMQGNKLQSTLTDLDRKQTTLIHQRQQEQEYLSSRAKKMNKICSFLNISVNFDLEQCSKAEMDSVLQNIKESIKLEDDKISGTSKDYEKDDQEKQTQIDKLRVNQAKIESDITSKKLQNTQLEKDYRKNELEIKEVGTFFESLNKLTKEIERVTECCNSVNASLNLDEIKTSVARKKQNVASLQEQFYKLDDKLTFLNSISTRMAEIDLKRKELEKKEQEIKRMKNKHADNLRKIFPNQTIELNYKRNLQSAYEKIQSTVKDLNTKLDKLKLKEKELQIKRKNYKDELVKWEKQLEECNDKIYDVCHSSNYDELVDRSKKIIQKLQLDHGAIKSSEAMYKKYIQKIGDDPCCPLCHKNMSTNEAADLTLELSDEIHHLPDNIRKTEQQLNKEQLKFDKLLALRPFIEKVEKLGVDIPQRKIDLKETEKDLANIANEIENNQLLSAEPSSNIDVVNGMLGDMSVVDEALKDVSRLNAQINNLKENLPEGDSTISIEDVQLEKATVLAELKNENSEIDTLQTKYDKANETLNKLREKRDLMIDKQLKLQQGVQSLPQLKERQKELIAKIEIMKKDIIDLQQQLEPLKLQLNSSIEEKQTAKIQNRKLLEEMTTKSNSLKKIDHDIHSYTKELKSLAELNLAEEIEKGQATMETLLASLKEKTNENIATTKEIEKNKIDVVNQEALERDLKDNQELKQLEQEEILLKDQQEDLLKDIGELDYEKISKEHKELNNRRNLITAKQGELMGQMGEINNQINKLKKEIDDPLFKEATKNYRRIFYEVEVIKKIVADLGQYRIAIEWALMKFHSEKMEKINRLIREFWRQIYRGNDIDYIQIFTDEIKTEGVDRKRSYNYRVIQSKNNSEIDMRGRCSAGQRVLASLIIRMALAETFSSNCGVLALDEPTTNLDRNNILSLCEALNRIVEERQSQSNFMLIIITHDEDFISTLGKIRSYHKVFRNDEGKSVIRKVKVL